MRMKLDGRKDGLRRYEMTEFTLMMGAAVLVLLLLPLALAERGLLRVRGGTPDLCHLRQLDPRNGKDGVDLREDREPGGGHGLVEKKAPQTEDDKMLALLEGEMEMEGSEAIGIRVRLSSRDDRVEVLSRPQLRAPSPGARS
jgi:hypothetical protein